jgi:hypothetical protein
MGNKVGAVLYVLMMVVVIVGIDLVFFRDRPWLRLAVNVGIVVVFAGSYVGFLRRS